jgi:hypothetical protein
MDLIIEVELTRRTKDDHADDYSQEPTEEKFDLVLVFRQDGSIENAGGRIGTWAVSGSGTGTNR